VYKICQSRYATYVAFKMVYIFTHSKLIIAHVPRLKTRSLIEELLWSRSGCTRKEVMRALLNSKLIPGVSKRCM
jgi:predicted CoA-binding protein